MFSGKKFYSKSAFSLPQIIVKGKDFRISGFSNWAFLAIKVYGTFEKWAPESVNVMTTALDRHLKNKVAL